MEGLAEASVVTLSTFKALSRQGRSISHDERTAHEIGELAGLDLDRLRARWLKITGRSAPKAFRTGMLRKALAYELQVAVFGGLPSSRKRQLRDLARAARENRFDEALGTTHLKPGTMLMRVWEGKTENVTVVRDGYVWAGESYTSLSAIARAITGTSWNGWTFFGLKRPSGRNKNAAKARIATADLSGISANDVAAAHPVVASSSLKAFGRSATGRGSETGTPADG